MASVRHNFKHVRPQVALLGSSSSIPEAETLQCCFLGSLGAHWEPVRFFRQVLQRPTGLNTVQLLRSASNAPGVQEKGRFLPPKPG